MFFALIDSAWNASKNACHASSKQNENAFGTLLKVISRNQDKRYHIIKETADVNSSIW
jgi:hypothetical protein